MIRILTLLSILVLCFSCSTSLHESFINAPVGVSASVELDAEVTVGGEISGSAEETVLFGFFKVSGPNKFADNVFGGIKSAAAYNALHDSGADVIVNPQYVYEVDDQFFTKTTKCTVTGYAGTVSVK